MLHRIFQSKSKIFLLSLLAFVIGVFVASFISVSVFVLYVCCVALLLGCVLMQQKNIRIIIFWLLCFVLGIARMILSQPNLHVPDHIAFYNDQAVTVVGVVTQEPDVRLDHQKLIIKINSPSSNEEGVRGWLRRLSVDSTPPPSPLLNTGGGAEKGRLLVKTPLYPEYTYGDELRITCHIQAPEPIEDFSYDTYLARYDIYSVCWRGSMQQIASGRGNAIMAAILATKARFMNSVNQIMSEPYAAFLSGLLVGARRGIPEYLLEAFNRTGTTHIIAISGSNITIIAAVIIGLLEVLGISRGRSFWLTSGSIIMFVIMTGATASVVRAGIMGIFVLLARELGRASRATNALVFTAFLMLLVNPKILVFDAGFQLSFLATIGLIYVNPILQRCTRALPDCAGMKEALVTTLSAMTTTTPLILFQFGRFSLVAPLANILILPAIPITMALGFAAGVVGIFSASVGSVVAWPAWLFLEYMIRVAELLSSIHFASIVI